VKPSFASSPLKASVLRGSERMVCCVFFRRYFGGLRLSFFVLARLLAFEGSYLVAWEKET
jgi:hypothetical protein